MMIMMIMTIRNNASRPISELLVLKDRNKTVIYNDQGSKIKEALWRPLSFVVLAQLFLTLEQELSPLKTDWFPQANLAHIHTPTRHTFICPNWCIFKCSDLVNDIFGFVFDQICSWSACVYICYWIYVNFVNKLWVSDNMQPAKNGIYQTMHPTGIVRYRQATNVVAL